MSTDPIGQSEPRVFDVTEDGEPVLRRVLPRSAEPEEPSQPQSWESLEAEADAVLQQITEHNRETERQVEALRHRREQDRAALDRRWSELRERIMHGDQS